MKTVIIPNYHKKEDKPVEFIEQNHSVQLTDWKATGMKPDMYDNVLWQRNDGKYDYFICWDNGAESLGYFRGHLNSGKY